MGRASARPPPAHLFRQPRQPRRLRAGLDGAAGAGAAADAAGRRRRILAEGPIRRFIGERVFNAVLIEREAENAHARSDPADGGGARRRLLAHPLPGRHAQPDRGAAPALQERALPAGAGAARRRDGAGLDRQPQPRHAEGRADPGADPLHRLLRHAGPAARGRGEDGVPRARARGAAVAPAARSIRAHDGRASRRSSSSSRIGCVLVAATAVGMVLARRRGDDARSDDREPQPAHPAPGG